MELGSAAFTEIGVALGVTKQLEKLKQTLKSINSTLVAPEADSAQIWFKRLQGVYYDAKEILDDFEFYQLQRQGSAGAKVRQFLSVSNNPFIFPSIMGRKIKGIRESLSRIKADKDACDTTKGKGGKGVSLGNATHTVSETFPFCKSSDVIGRDEDTQKILNFLTKDSERGSVSAIPIVGIGGIGKTALAFKVYSLQAIGDEFDLRLWVSVKEDFKDLKNLLRKILASASKYSEQLQNKDSLTLFKQSFGEDVVNRENLMEIGKDVVKKCGGVAGAIKTVARLLQGKGEEHQWLKVRDDFWKNFEKKGRFISYEELPFYLKPCFAYFSNLPKGFKILGIELIHQWIAQGFIQPSVETQAPEKVDSHVKDVPENVQHLSFSGKKTLQKDKHLSPLLQMRKVRTVGFQLLLLETLMLQGCVKFVKLPKGVGKLPKLRCLRLTTRERSLSGKLIAGLEKLQCLWIDECGQLEHLFDTEEVGNQHLLSTVSVLVIMNCKNLLSLPRKLSSLPKLENLVIVNCEKLDLTKIDECEVGLMNLQYLWVGKLPQLVDLPGWLLEGAATTLNHLRIMDCSTITTLPNDLKYLRKLSIEGCQKIASLPDGTSYLAKLEELRISECPELISRCQRERGADWHKISKVRYIFLDGINVQDSTTNELVHFRTSYHYFISFHIV
ncbi:hypothetical protein LguiB_021778 [Lonicera macranthoides]